MHQSAKVLLTLGFNSLAYVDLPPLGFYPQVRYRLFFLVQLPCFSPVKLAFSPWTISILLGKTNMFAMKTRILPGKTSIFAMPNQHFTRETAPVNRSGHRTRHRDGAVVDVLRCEGRCLLTASADGTVRLWDAETWIWQGSWQGSTGINYVNNNGLIWIIPV